MEKAAVTARTETQLTISVVIPVYKAEGIVHELHRRLTAVLAEEASGAYEIILVEDRSPDRSWEEIRQIAGLDPRVHGIRLSRNFGQLAATTAGLEAACGNWVAIMDCDLQDRPEDLPQLLAKAREGFDVVQARRAKGGPLIRRTGTKAYFGVLRWMTGVDIDWELAAFSVLHAKVKDAFLDVTDRNRNLLLVLAWLGFNSTSVDVAHDDRFAGESSYSFRTLLTYALDGMFFQTVAPLRWIVYWGFWVALASIIAALFLIFQWFNETVYPGWTSLMVVALFLGGVTLSSLGIVGIYVGKVFDQVKGRPVFVVDDEINSPKATA